METRKSPFTSAVAAVLTLSLVSQAFGYSVISTASAAEVTQVGVQMKGIAAVEGALKQFSHELKSQVLQEDAMAHFAGTLVENEVTIQDIDNYALVNYSPEQYVKFHETIETVKNMKGADGKMSVEDTGRVMTGLILNDQQNGLSIAGCGAFAAGIVLAIGAVIVGIVALANTRGESRIRAEYSDRKSSLQVEYNAKITYYQNWQTTLPNEIKKHQDKIDYNNTKISYYNGVIAGSDPNTEQGQANIKNASYYIKLYTEENSKENAAVNELNGIYQGFINNPASAQAIVVGLQNEYQVKLDSLSQQEQADVSKVPANKKRAGTLGIVAGVSAALAVVLLVGNDGCN